MGHRSYVKPSDQRIDSLLPRLKPRRIALKSSVPCINSSSSFVTTKVSNNTKQMAKIGIIGPINDGDVATPEKNYYLLAPRRGSTSDRNQLDADAVQGCCLIKLYDLNGLVWDCMRSVMSLSLEYKRVFCPVGPTERDRLSNTLLQTT